MKKVYLVRHGKAVSRYEDIPDYERTLIDRGRETTQQIAERLALRGISPDVIVSSPAPRAEETARIIAKELGYRTKKILSRKAIYDQPPNALFEVLRGLDDAAHSAMLVGHDPSMSDMVLELSGDTKIELPTSGAVGVELNIESWADVNLLCGRVRWYEDPKRPPPKPTKKELKSKLKQELTDSIGTAVENVTDVSADKMRKPVAKAAGKLAKKIAGAMIKSEKAEKSPKKLKKTKKSKK